MALVFGLPSLGFPLSERPTRGEQRIVDDRDLDSESPVGAAWTAPTGLR